MAPGAAALRRGALLRRPAKCPNDPSAGGPTLSASEFCGMCLRPSHLKTDLADRCSTRTCKNDLRAVSSSLKWQPCHWPWPQGEVDNSDPVQSKLALLHPSKGNVQTSVPPFADASTRDFAAPA
eukprot:21693-Pleurochrysis_carterae.AAC.1